MSTTQDDVLTFFSTCSIQELNWFIDSAVSYFTNDVGDIPVFDKEDVSLALRIDKCNRAVTYPGSHPSVEVVASKLSKSVNNPCQIRKSERSALMQSTDIPDEISAFFAALTTRGTRAWDNSLVEAKPSRIRCRNTILKMMSLFLDQLEDRVGQGQWSSMVREEFLSAPPVARTKEETEVNDKIPNYALPECSVYTRDAMMPEAANGCSGEKVTLVLPCAGRSSRFPGHKPKWLLTQPNGRLMIVDAISNLDLRNVNRVVVGVLREHLVKYCGNDHFALLSTFADGPLHLMMVPITLVVVAEETIDQVQTIECILNAAQVTGPIFLKDCDNQFSCAVTVMNGVSSLEITRDVQSVSIPAAKSYITTEKSGKINNIVEKAILGNTFCVGGYSFASTTTFLETVVACRTMKVQAACTETELAVSDVIWMLMLTNPSEEFFSIPVTGYEDWGTLGAWQAYTKTFLTLFIDIDGTLIKNAGQYFAPRWGYQPALPDSVAYLQALKKKGRVQIILTTSRTESVRRATEVQLKLWDIPYDQLVMGMLHAQRVVVNDYAKTNPFPSAAAINLKRDSDSLREYLGLEL
jgi:hypothetical protein